MQRLNGFIKVHRKLLQWGWYQDYVVKDLFLHLLLTAAFQESQWMGQVIHKGQVITSYKHLSDDLGFSVKQIRTALDKLKSTGEVTSTSTNKYTIVTVVNWEEYQSFEIKVASKTASQAANEGQASGKQRANEGQASGKQRANEGQHRKNVKNDKNVKKERNMPPVASEDALSAEEKKRIYKELTE